MKTRMLYLLAPACSTVARMPMLRYFFRKETSLSLISVSFLKKTCYSAFTFTNLMLFTVSVEAVILFEASSFIFFWYCLKKPIRA